MLYYDVSNGISEKENNNLSWYFRNGNALVLRLYKYAE